VGKRVQVEESLGSDRSGISANPCQLLQAAGSHANGPGRKILDPIRIVRGGPQLGPVNPGVKKARCQRLNPGDFIPIALE
jgi:hypothetical protein